MCVPYGCGLAGVGIEFLWERDFPHPSIRAMGSTQPSVQCVPGFFLWAKAAEAWR